MKTLEAGQKVQILGRGGRDVWGGDSSFSAAHWQAFKQGCIQFSVTGIHPKKYLWWLVVFVYMEDSKLATLLGTDEDKIIRHPPPPTKFSQLLF